MLLREWNEMAFANLIIRLINYCFYLVDWYGLEHVNLFMSINGTL